MKLEYTITQTDIEQFQAYHYWHTPKEKFRITRRLYQGFIWLILFFGFTYLLGSLHADKRNDDIFLLMTIGGIVFLIGLYRAEETILRALRKGLKKNLKEGRKESLLGRQSLELNSDKIINIFQGGESSFNTSAIEKIRDDDHSYYIYISSIQAIVIPKRAITSESSEDFKTWVSKFSA